MSNRLTYADLNGDGEVTPGEIIEENNYYPFGLKHQGYNELAGDTLKYKFLNREYQPELGLNTIATDYRHYDAALGRFNNMDALSELAPAQTPYRYGFNNPVYWTDPTGLFETYAAAQAFAMDELKLKDGDYNIEEFEYGGYVLHVTSGEFDGRAFYYATLQGIDDLEIVGSGGAGGNQSGEGNNNSDSGNNINWAQVNQGVNAFGFANGTKTLLIDMAAEAGELSKGTQNYLRAFRGVGYVGAGITTTYSAIKAGSYYYNGGSDWQVGAKAALDITMTVVGFLGPVGFGISATYFLLDTAGAFGEFGQINP